jgi:hypothetical protein
LLSRIVSADMRRLERVELSLPDRRGINPFTRQPIVISGRSPRTTSVAVSVDGNDVTLTWTWEEEGKPACHPHVEKHRLKDSSDAEAYARDCIDELTSDGFRDLDGAYRTAGDHAPARRTTQASSPGVASMAIAIVRRCREQRWFGCDMHRKHERMRSADSIEERRFRFPPATDLQLAETERLLGFALPAALRGLYKEVANGGFGPGYGIVGAMGGARTSEGDRIADLYRIDREPRPLEEWGRPGQPRLVRAVLQRVAAVGRAPGRLGLRHLVVHRRAHGARAALRAAPGKARSRGDGAPGAVARAVVGAVGAGAGVVLSLRTLLWIPGAMRYG